MATPTNNYADKKEMYALLKTYRDTGCRKAYNRLGKIFLSIATNLINKPCFINYTADRKDDMISDATLMMIRKIDSFDLDKYDNPFSFYTTTAYNMFLQYLNKKNNDAKIFVNLSYIENYETGGSE